MYGANTSEPIQQADGDDFARRLLPSSHTHATETSENCWWLNTCLDLELDAEGNERKEHTNFGEQTHADREWPLLCPEKEFNPIV